MGIRIHRVMGWGLDWNRFEMISTLPCEGHETSEVLYDVMRKATSADLTVPEDFRKMTWNSTGINSIIEPVLLARDLNFRERRGKAKQKPKLAAPNELYHLVMDCDNTHAVVFLPSALFIKIWYHYTDDLDYYFEQYREGAAKSADTNMRDVLETMKFGPYPFGNLLMDPRTGEPLEWDSFHRLDKTYPNGWAPGVPSELRWWVKKLGILDDAGVNELRPMLAQYWC